MVVVSIDEVVEWHRRIQEINSTPLKDLLFVGKDGHKIGCKVIKLDDTKIMDIFNRKEANGQDWSVYNLITSGKWKECVK